LRNVDYIGIVSDEYNSIGEGDLQYIGVIRNLNDGTQLRCFAATYTNCTAPANSGHIPQGVPYLVTALPVVSAATEKATENADGSPNHGIPGALITTPNAGSSPKNYWAFAVNNMTPKCAQSVAFDTLTQNQIVYVSQYPFGGTVGTQDAVVIDGFAIGPPNHLERYYYVKGYGRVLETVAYQASGNPNYTIQTQVVAHNILEPLSASVININTGGCGQGSAVNIS
jgi:hypothetical protein